MNNDCNISFFKSPRAFLNSLQQSPALWDIFYHHIVHFELAQNLFKEPIPFLNVRVLEINHINIFLNESFLVLVNTQDIVIESVCYSLLTSFFFYAIVGLTVNVSTLSSLFSYLIAFFEVLLDVNAMQRYSSLHFSTESSGHEVFICVNTGLFRLFVFYSRLFLSLESSFRI